MGILLGFFFICLVLYAVLVTAGVFFLLKFLLVGMLGFTVSFKWLWSIINGVLWAIACRVIYFFVQDARGNSSGIEGVWKFFLVVNTILFLIVFWVGNKFVSR